MANGNTECSEDGCSNTEIVAKGLCKKHYDKQWRESRPVVECKEDGCSKPVKGRGWCGMHYDRVRKTGDPNTVRSRWDGHNLKMLDCLECGEQFHSIDDANRWCSRECWDRWVHPAQCTYPDCEETKIYARRKCHQHYMLERYHDDPDGHAAYQREWREANPGKQAEYGARYKAKQTPEEKKFANRKQTLRNYNLTPELFDLMFAEQGFVCKSCKADNPGKGQENWSIDHDHACCPQRKGCCGKCIRGIICNGCNSAIGYAQDDAERLRAMADYLDHYAMTSSNHMLLMSPGVPCLFG